MNEFIRTNSRYMLDSRRRRSVFTYHSITLCFRNMLQLSSTARRAHHLIAWLFLFAIAVMSFENSHAQVTIVNERSQESSFFEFDKIPPPAVDDSAANARWAVARGSLDSNSAPLSVIHDGRIPSSDDSPRENCFFAPGVSNGCIALDLGKSIDISEVVTYSWHAGARGPQVFNLYASTVETVDFKWDQIDEKAIIEKSGWQRVASIDSRTNRMIGGQYASAIRDTSGSLGTFRYLLFEVQPTETTDAFGNTFFCEIDVVEKGSEKLKRISVPESVLIRFQSSDGKYDYTIDATAAPELAGWSETELKPVILEWYPRIVAMLPSDGFQPSDKVRFRYLNSEKMNGIPAYAQGATISMNAGWMQRERNREAKGAIVHEMVHVVQSYQGRRQRGERRMPTPGWIVEGIPDYIRWFVYEPETRGAALSKQARANAKHDASYRVSANFIDWVIRTSDKDGMLLQRLNAAAREGRYSTDLWKQLTGHTEEELATDWRKE